MFKFFEYVLEVIGWIRIVLSPLLIGLLIGAVVYFCNPTPVRMVIGIIILCAGLITGIILASRIWKKGSTIRFLSQVAATPDLDSEEAEKD